jgi:hypothetical protein
MPLIWGQDQCGQAAARWHDGQNTHGLIRILPDGSSVVFRRADLNAHVWFPGKPDMAKSTATTAN